MEINKMIYEEILQKLANDGYITTKVEPDVEQPSYNVTFKGRLFNGYEAEQAALVEHKARLDALENENHKLQIANTQNSSKLNSLTLILVIGTVVAAVYYLLEILNHWVCIYPKR